MNTDDLPDVLTVDETARLLRISRGLAFAAVRQGDIPSLRIGRRLLVPRRALLRMLNADDESKCPVAEEEVRTSPTRGRA